MSVSMDEDRLYEIFCAKDDRFDGKFYIGVASTGIYCRPVCRARIPKKENCSYYVSAAQAEQEGFRPCLICRPELAPGVYSAQENTRLAQEAARLLDTLDKESGSIAYIAEQLHISERHFRRLFFQCFHVSPIQYLQTSRLLLAKNLLTDTSLPIIDVALGAGFQSLRRFNDAFLKHYRMSPTSFRKEVKKENAEKEQLTIMVGYQAPYRYEELLRFLEARAIPGVEMVTNGIYTRSVRIPLASAKHGVKDTPEHDAIGWIRVKNCPEKNALKVTLSDTLLRVLPQVIGRIRRQFDTDCDPEVVAQVLEDMNKVLPDSFHKGIRLPGCFDPFEMSVRAVLGQQITVKAACTLAGRMARVLGKQLESAPDGITHLFPSADDVLAVEENLPDILGPIGIHSSRVRTISSLAYFYKGQDIYAASFLDPKGQMEQLLAIKGIGKWTAQYIAMRAMSHTDSFLETDYGVKKALGDRTEQERRELSEQWSPWRSYATVSIWNIL